MYTVNISDISGMKSLFPVTCWGVATPSVRMIIRGKNATPCTLGIESENNVLNTFKTWNIHEVVTKFRLFKNCKWINCSNTIHLFILQWTYNTMCLSYWFVNFLLIDLTTAKDSRSPADKGLGPLGFKFPKKSYSLYYINFTILISTLTLFIYVCFN